jgi:glucose/arabinose dehydrogenase
MRSISSIFIVLLAVTNLVFAQANYQTIISGLNLPTVFAFMPNGNIIVNQQKDSTFIYNSVTGQRISCFWNFKDSCYYNGETGVIGVCLDPAFNSNRFVYIYYVGTDSTINVVRFIENNNLGTNPVKIFRYKRTGINWQGPHVAGNVHFGPQNKLYFSVGDAGVSDNAQLLTNPLGKIIRINSDGTIPNDNPFYDDGNPSTGNDDRIWAYGLRNPWDFTFSPYNDSIYLTENGQAANDEINFVRKGKNYGWPICRGYCVPYNPLYRQPMDTIGGNGGNNYAPTGIIVYSGSIYPTLTGKVITSNIATSSPVTGILRYDLGNFPFNDTITSHSKISTLVGTTLIQHTDGYIYLCRFNVGSIVKLLPDPLGINNNSVPSDFWLEQNYPNPFNPYTAIKYNTGRESFVSVKIYDITGKEIAVLVNENKQQGSYEVVWNAASYPSGIYFYRLTAGEFSEEKKMVLIK